MMMYLHQSFSMGVKEDGLLAADLQLLESRPTPPAVLDNNINNAANDDNDVLTNEDDLELLKVDLDLDQRYFISTLHNQNSWVS